MRYSFDFPTAHPTRYEENNTVCGEYFQPGDEGKYPLVILLHGMGDELLIPCKLLSKHLVKRGMACIVPYSVFHSRRAPETVRKRLPHLTSEEWFEGYRISVIDVRQMIDWASSRSEVDKDRIAVLGISFGGFISAITMGVDRRIKAGVLLVAGGNSGKIGRKSWKRSMKKYKITEAEYNHNQKSYKQYLAEVAEKGFENVNAPSKSFLVDPMTFTPYLRKRPVMMLNARWDEYIPREATIDFWKACGKPLITWFPATHTSFWLWYPLIRRKITRFLNTALNGSIAGSIQDAGSGGRDETGIRDK